MSRRIRQGAAQVAPFPLPPADHCCALCPISAHDWRGVEFTAGPGAVCTRCGATIEPHKIMELKAIGLR